MKLASSNIALTTYDHIAQLKPLADMGISGIEIAPSRVWRDTWKGLKASDVSAYRRAIETAGLDVVGLHSLFYDQPDLRFSLQAPEKLTTSSKTLSIPGTFMSN